MADRNFSADIRICRIYAREVENPANLRLILSKLRPTTGGPKKVSHFQIIKKSY